MNKLVIASDSAGKHVSHKDKNNQGPLVYIVVLNWNGWRDTLRCIASLKALRYPYFEIVVIDNASSDDSVIRIREKYPEIKMIINDKNRGFAGGCNPGIRMAIGANAKYVWLINNDAIADRNALGALVDLMESCPNLGASGSLIYDLDFPEKMLAWGGGRINWVFGISRHCNKEVDDDSLDYITGASLFLRVEAIQDVGLLDERYFMYWEDADICIRLRKARWRLSVGKASRVFHAESSSVGKRSSLQTQYFNASSVRFFRKHSNFPWVPLGLGLCLRVIKRIFKGDFSGCRDVFIGIHRGLLDKSMRNS